MEFQTLNTLEQKLSEWHADCDVLNAPEAEALAQQLLAWRGQSDFITEEALYTAVVFLESYVRDTGSRVDEFHNFLLRVIDGVHSPLVESQTRGYLLIIYGDVAQLEPLAQLLITSDVSEAVPAFTALTQAATRNVKGAKEAIQQLLHNPSLGTDMRDMLLAETTRSRRASIAQVSDQ